MSTLDINTLRSIAETNPAAKALFQYFAARGRARGETDTSVVSRVVSQVSGQPKTEVAKVFAALESLGAGKLMGDSGRFKWYYNLISVAKAAQSTVHKVAKFQPRNKALPRVHFVEKTQTDETAVEKEEPSKIFIRVGRIEITAPKDDPQTVVDLIKKL